MDSANGSVIASKHPGANVVDLRSKEEVLRRVVQNVAGMEPKMDGNDRSLLATIANVAQWRVQDVQKLGASGNLLHPTTGQSYHVQLSRRRALDVA